MSLLEDLGVNVKDVFDFATLYQQNEINKGVAKTAAQAQEWNMQLQLAQLQNQYAGAATSSKAMIWLAVLGVVGLVGYAAFKG